MNITINNQQEPYIKFISYDGKWPCLCFGTLVYEHNGKTKSCKGCMTSGGSVTHDANWNFEVEQGPWKLSAFDLKDLTPEELYDLEKQVNDNVEEGCCGGCI